MVDRGIETFIEEIKQIIDDSRSKAMRSIDFCRVQMYWAIGRRISEKEQQRQLRAWQLVQRGHAVANGLPVIAVNRVGHEPDPSAATPGIQFWGHSFVCGPQGEFLAEGDEADRLLLVDIDLTRSEQVRRWWPFLRDRRIEYFTPLAARYLD